MKTLLLLVFLALSPLLTRAAETNTYPPVKFPDMSGWGKNIQRTMRLLATSTAEKRNTVRILFYGQSITEQKWGLNLDGVKFTRVPGVNEPIITTNVESLLQNP